MKSAFYFILKALFVHKIFKFLPWLFGQLGKMAWLERFIALISKFIASPPGSETITIHILLSNISRSKGNQTMTFG